MNIRRKTLAISTHTGRWITEPLRLRYLSRYHGKYTWPRVLFAFDLILFGAGIGAAATALSFLLFGFPSIANQIDFTADIAPTPIVSGAPSTLVLSWRNTSKEELRDASIVLSYPAHFLRQEVSLGDAAIEGDTLPIGTILPSGTGSIKIRGVIMGDIGGKQTFRSTMSFRYGERNRSATKISTHTFSPASSALTIEADVPDTLVAGQDVHGILRVKNTGPIDFETIVLTPSRTDFQFKPVRGAWTVPSLPSGSSTEITFDGRAPATDAETTQDWKFSASFSYADATYRQSETVRTFRLIPSPLIAEETLDGTALSPGGNASLAASFRNISDQTLDNLTFFVEAESPFFAPRDGEGVVYEVKQSRWTFTNTPRTLAPSEVLERRVSVPVRTSIAQSSTTAFENFTGTIRLGATFTIKATGVAATVMSRPVTLPITSPATLIAFGRYSTEEGDQLGRGPLPPVVGEETNYWVFWNVGGTTNALTNVEIRGALPTYARFTGKQTVSSNGAVTVEDGDVVWRASELAPTFAPGSKVIGIAFEIGVTPNEAHIGASLPILDRITLTATDAVTGATVRAFGARITTELPNDTMARGYGKVGR